VVLGGHARSGAGRSDRRPLAPFYIDLSTGKLTKTMIDVPLQLQPEVAPSKEIDVHLDGLPSAARKKG